MAVPAQFAKLLPKSTCRRGLGGVSLSGGLGGLALSQKLKPYGRGWWAKRGREEFGTCRRPKQVERCMSKLAKKDLTTNKLKEHSIKGEKRGDPSSWFPHPKTGIYFPAGQECVMDDVPNGAASFVESYWLRNTNGVEKPEDDASFYRSV